MPSSPAPDARLPTTHAGSLPRPPWLKSMLAAAFRGGDVEPAALDAETERAVAAVLDRQLEAGIDIVGDGEQGRESFFTYVQHRMSGFAGKSSRRPMADMARYPGYREMMVAKAHRPESVSLMAAPRAVGPVRHLGPGPVEAECRRLVRLLAARGLEPGAAFLTAPSPGIIAAAMENAYYPDQRAYLAALGEALAVEYRTIVAHGFTLQIDAPDLAMERHCLYADRPLEEYLDFAADVVDTLNEALAGLPPERVRLHVCWGNYEGPHECDVALRDIWGTLTRTRVGALLLSLANPRHAHEYRDLGRLVLPEPVRLVVGVIDTTTNYVEHPELVADRLERTARALGDPTRLVAGTDCGFETAAGFQSVHDDIVWAKLRSLSEGARIASRRLFS